MLHGRHTPMLVMIASLCLGPASATLADGRVIITEIMYNPSSREDKSQTEWIEIANVGDQTVEIKDWRIDDEDKMDWGRFSCTLAPGGVAVLVNSNYLTEKQFREAWDGGDEVTADSYQVVAVNWGNLANTPSADNEVLQLRNDNDEVLCEVKQQGQWPECARPDGASIYLIDLSAEDLSDGRLWKKADTGVAGGRTNIKTEIFDGDDIGSPGFVPGLEAGPVAAAPKKPGSKPSNRPAAKPVASQPASRPDNKIDY